MAIRALLTSYAVPPTEVSILLTDDESIRRLNLTYRGVDSATDVLSFPSGTMPIEALGDIVISVSTARRQATERNIPLSHELAFLAIHGGLHLLGYDDRSEDERRDMVNRMNAVAEAIGLGQDPNWSSLPNG